MRLLACSCLLALGVAMSTCGAAAYTGGPFLAEILGFDRDTKRIYYVVHHDADGDPGSKLWYFALADSNPWEPVRAPWSSEPRLTRPDSLRCRLEPLLPEARGRIVLSVETLRADSVVVFDAKVPRALLGVELRRFEDRCRAEIVAYCGQGVSVAGVFQVPTEDYSSAWYTLVVLEYAGTTYGCEPVQTPVLLPNNVPPLRRIGAWR